MSQSCPPERTIAIAGLNQAGKSVIATFLSTGKINKGIPPTLAPNYSNLILNRIENRMVDLPGQSKLRKVWKRAVLMCRFLIYVVDTSDKNRFEESKGELQRLITEDYDKKYPLLMIFNKVDLPEAQKNLELAHSIFDTLIESKRPDGINVHYETTWDDPDTLDRIRNFIEYYLNDVSVNLGKFCQ